MSGYQALADCIRSGQLDAADVARHLAGGHFAAWYRRHYGGGA